MYQTSLPPWPDAPSANCAVITAEQLARLGRGDRDEGLRQLRLIIACEGERKVSAGPTARPGNVRLAGPEDEAPILARLLEDVAENAAHIAPPCEASIKAYLDTSSRRSTIGIIDGDDGRPAAVCVLVGAQWWWSDHWYLFEICNYVHPDYRRSSYIDDIIDFERWTADSVVCRQWKLSGLFDGRRGWGTRRLHACEDCYVLASNAEVGRAYLYPPPPPFTGYH